MLHQRDKETQRTDPTDLRKALGFRTSDTLRDRVAETMTSGVYSAPNISPAVTKESFGMQTDVKWVDKGVSEHDSYVTPPMRLEKLKLGLPMPSDFPLLTVSQLLDAEKRLSLLLAKLEDHVLRAEEDERREKEAKELAAAETQMAQATREGYLLSKDGDERETLSMFEGVVAENKQKWNEDRVRSIEKRMMLRHLDPGCTKAPTQWATAKLEILKSTPSKTKKERYKSPGLIIALQATPGKTENELSDGK